eukprot:TRINITY_DN14110_c0_g2_i1.p3 TRINITY_DN14110_c0_g2~~TRINITY_DN14110_c0_g2_i1.p3  ORF type:complete len:118 (-),score=10.25 TRINITY_DN14110_c0_g2_i1:69-422(-)
MCIRDRSTWGNKQLMESRKKALCINFNQDNSCFAVGTEKGFTIYNTQPFQETYSRDIGTGVRIVEMLYRSNFLALVGTGENPKFPSNKVMLRDDEKQRLIGELAFKSAVLALSLIHI